MACQHVLTNSVTYPVGTRCGRCGKSAESILADVQLQLSDVESKLREALARASTLDVEKTAAANLRTALEISVDSLQASEDSRAALASQLSQQLAQTESLSKENIRLTSELRQAVEREKALQRKLEDIELKRGTLPVLPVAALKK